MRVQTTIPDPANTECPMFGRHRHAKVFKAQGANTMPQVINKCECGDERAIGGGYQNALHGITPKVPNQNK